VQGWTAASSSPLWSSTKSDFIAGVTQSNPTVDPWKKCGEALTSAAQESVGRPRPPPRSRLLRRSPAPFSPPAPGAFILLACRIPARP
jgi:hypothetical protein